MKKPVYIVVSVEGFEFQDVEAVFFSKKEAEDYIKPREEPLAEDDISLEICESLIEIK